MRLARVISGGQTGVDVAALRAARALGVPTGGWMPRGFKTQRGRRPEYAELYGVDAAVSDDYAYRTALNVRASHATLRIAEDFDSAGEHRTLSAIRKYGRPHVDVFAFCLAV